jgi:hypothetical protein
MNLAQLQQAMSRDLAGAPSAELAAFVGDHPGLKVYRNTYRGSLLGCLRDTFEHCWSWLGDERFDAVANCYIDGHPPHTWTLDLYGDEFAAMLAAHFPDDREVAELAWLEWALRRAFDGADSPTFDPARLGEVVDWENARLTLTPTLRLGQITTNCAAIWTALENGQTPPPATVLAEPVPVLVWRHDLMPSFRTLQDHEAQALRWIISGMTFGAVCAHLAQTMGEAEAAACAGACLGQWLHGELITNID